jgi:hypothetical protein
MLRGFDELVAFLRAEGAAPTTVDAGAQALELATHAPPVEGALAIRWDPSHDLLQLFHPLPFTPAPERLAAVERAIARVNDALVIPGFGLRRDSGLLYFRLVVARHLDGALDEGELRRALSTVLTTLGDFWVPLRRVALDGADPDAVLADARSRHR